MKKILRIVLLSTGIFVVLILMLMGGFLIAIQQEDFQNYLKNQALPYLEEVLATKVELQRIAVRFPDKILLQGLLIEDLQQDTLFALQELEADLDMRRLFHREVVVEHIGVTGVKARIYKLAGKGYNFDFLIDAFTADSVPVSEKTDTAALDIAFELNSIALSEVDLRFNDDSLFNAHLTWKEFTVKPAVLELNTQRFRLNLLEMKTAVVDIQKPGTPTVEKGFNPGHIHLQELNFKLTDIVYNPDTLAAEIASLSFGEQSGFRLNQLSVGAVLESKRLTINDLYLRTPHTRIQNSTVLEFDSIGQLSTDLSKVRIKTTIRNSFIGLRDVLLFQPGLSAGEGISLPPVLTAALDFEGTINRFRTSVRVDSELAGFEAKAAVQSIDPDAPQGTLQLKDIYVKTDSLDVELESVQVNAEVRKGIKSLELKLPFAQLAMQGNYKLGQLGNVVNNLMVKHFNVTNATYLPEDNQFFNLKLQVDDHPFVHQFLPDSLSFSPLNIQMKYQSQGRKLEVEGAVDLVLLGAIRLKTIGIQAFTEGESLKFAAQLKQIRQRELEVPPLEITGKLLRDIADFSVLMRDTLHQEENRISGRVDLSGFKSVTNSQTPAGPALRSGDFAPELNLELVIDRIALKSFEAFAAGYIEKTEGYLTGNLNINDITGKMKMAGVLKSNQLALKILMLDETFRIPSADIVLQQDVLEFRNFHITDEKGEKLILGGKAGFREFKDVWFDLSVRAQNFRAMSSTSAVNDLFFGDLYLGMDLTVKGNPELPVVGGRLTVNDKSKLTISVPQTDPMLTDRSGIVEFVNHGIVAGAEAPVLIDSLKQAVYKGMDVGVDIAIDKNADFTIILDKVTGDFVRLKGEGLLSGAIDPSGKMSLTGKYEFYEGDYELNVSLIQRRFAIRKGSSILWTGDPFSAQLDLVATYTTRTAPLSLVESRIGSVSQEVRNRYLQRMPFVTQLKVTGELMKPMIGFDIVLDEEALQISQDVISTTKSELTSLRTEPPRLYKQVFALLLFNQFLAENPFNSSGGGSPELLVRESAGRIIAQQLNQLAGNLVKGIDIEFDVNALDDYSTGVRESRTDLNVALSKQFFDNRLKITVGSSFGLEGTPYENQSSSNIAGNFRADYLITPDGRYKLRAYRKNEYQMALLGEIVETGLTFIITMDYDSRNELVRKR